MNNLLHADFRRLLRDRLFWVLTAVMAIWAIILFLNHYSDKIRYGEQASLDSMFFSFAVLTGFASAAFCSLFTGREHSDGILRNKIIIGCSRTRIYLSGFLTCAAAMLLSTFAYMAVLCVLGIPVFGLFEGDPGGLLLIFAASALLNLVHVALFHLVSMLNSSKSASAIICMALSLLLLVAASLLLQRLAQPELIQQVQMVDGSFSGSQSQISDRKHTDPLSVFCGLSPIRSGSADCFRASGTSDSDPAVFFGSYRPLKPNRNLPF